MLTKSTLIAAVAVATLSLAPSAFAQSFSKSDGTGNSLPAYYDTDGGLHVGVAPQQSNTKIAVDRNRLNAVAQRRQVRPQEQEALRHGDFYAPSKTVVQRATTQEQDAFRHGDFYAPTVD